MGGRSGGEFIEIDYQAASRTHIPDDRLAAIPASESTKAFEGTALPGRLAGAPEPAVTRAPQPATLIPTRFE
jgi:hypothetical protein